MPISVFSSTWLFVFYFHSVFCCKQSCKNFSGIYWFWLSFCKPYYKIEYGWVCLSDSMCVFTFSVNDLFFFFFLNIRLSLTSLYQALDLSLTSTASHSYIRHFINIRIILINEKEKRSCWDIHSSVFLSLLDLGPWSLSCDYSNKTARVCNHTL